jgi:CNT family concentrative nucleoside transporter
MMMYVWGLFSIYVVLGIGFLFSMNRKRINWRTYLPTQIFLY